jgi:hypothetical protein
MEILKYAKAIVNQPIRVGVFCSLLALVLKADQVASLLKSLAGSIFQPKAQQTQQAQEVQEKHSIKNLKKMQVELSPFFEGHHLTEEAIRTFVPTLFNDTIDLEGDLLGAIQKRKLEMIREGEQRYLSLFPKNSSFVAVFHDPTVQKMMYYASRSFEMAEDIDYQQKMLMFQQLNERNLEIIVPSDQLP